METLSPSTAKRDRTDKKDAYERAGVEEYWIVSPQGAFPHIKMFLGEIFEGI